MSNLSGHVKVSTNYPLTITGNFTLSPNTYNIVISNLTANSTLTLPALSLSYNGYSVTIVNNSNFVLTIQAALSDNINGSNSIKLNNNQSIQLVVDFINTTWQICTGLDNNINPVLNNLGVQCTSVKQLDFASGSWVNVLSHSGSPGTIKKLWLALNNTNSTTTFLAISFDGSPTAQFGSLTNPLSATVSNSISCQLLLGNGFDSTTAFYTNKFSMSKLLPGTGIGGYITVDMPYQSSFDIWLLKPSGGIAQCWVQAFFENSNLYKNNVYIRAFAYDAGSFTDKQEKTLFTISGTNGVALLGTRIFFVGGSNNWFEGRIRIKRDGTTFYTSSGTEDYFLTSYTFPNIFTTDVSGVLYNNSGAPANPNANVSAYRFYDSSTAPSSLTTSNISLTWTCGDPIGDPGNNASLADLLGIVLYYA